MSIFDKAKATPTASNKKKGEVIAAPTDEIKQAIDNFAEFSDEIKSLTGAKDFAKATVEDWAFEAWVKLCEQNKLKPETPTLMGGSKSIKFIVMDKYTNFSDEDEIPQELEAHIETVRTFSFNTEVLEKHMDVISEAIAKVIPPADLENLLVVKETRKAKSGTIDRLIGEGKSQFIKSAKPVFYVR